MKYDVTQPLNRTHILFDGWNNFLEALKNNRKDESNGENKDWLNDLVKIKNDLFKDNQFREEIHSLW